ncbi:hypothetical protein SUSAZ_09120 [Sulfolobus acidocaldarius SUSAZ]|nr:hypothetical protein SUSAZ_09120 [Sulfolobus acidocaldarius SUSAZ]
MNILMWMRGILLLILMFIASFIALYVYEYASLNSLNSNVVKKLSYSLILFPLDQHNSTAFIIFPQDCLNLNASVVRLSNGSYMTTYSNPYNSISYVSSYPVLFGVNFTEPNTCKIGLLNNVKIQLIYENLTKSDGITIFNYGQHKISQGPGFPFLVGKVLGNQFLVVYNSVLILLSIRIISNTEVMSK